MFVEQPLALSRYLRDVFEIFLRELGHKLLPDPGELLQLPLEDVHHQARLVLRRHLEMTGNISFLRPAVSGEVD